MESLNKQDNYFENLSNDVELEYFIRIFFLTYNLIKLSPDELYQKSINKQFNQYYFSKNKEIKEIYTSMIDLIGTKLEKTESNNYIFIPKGIRIIDKNTDKQFYIETLLNRIDFDFEFINFFPKITTNDIRDIVKKRKIDFLRNIIIKNINNIDFPRDKIIEINNVLLDNDINPDLPNNNFSLILISNTISSDDFLGINDILEIIFTNKEYKKEQEYINLQKIIDSFEQSSKTSYTHSIQYFNNLLFLQNIKLNEPQAKKIYYFYFSFGTLNFYEYVDWKDSLKIYVDKIKELLSDPLVDSIILAGHSMGSIAIQHLAIELINNNIDTKKIFIIGSGCRVSEILTDEQLLLFKKEFSNRYFFVLSGVKKGINPNEEIYYDHRDTSSLNKVNKINTHFLLCNGITENNTNYHCDSTLLEILDSNKVNTSGQFVPNPNIILHEFKTYSDFYLDL